MFVSSADPVLASPAKGVRCGPSTAGAAQKFAIGAANVVAWPEVVIFDCDGVLVDSETIALDETRKALDEAGLRLTEAQALDRFLGRPLDAIVHLARAERAARLPEDFSETLNRRILVRFEKELKGVAGVREAVAGLRSRVCVASSSPPERIRRSLALAGYDDLFSTHVFSSSMVPHGKPRPDIYLHAARKMSVAAEDCLVIEDSVAGLRAARGAGMEAFAFVGGSHFSRASDVRPLVEAGALLTFDHMARLPALVTLRERERQAPKTPPALARVSRPD